MRTARLVLILALVCCCLPLMARAEASAPAPDFFTAAPGCASRGLAQAQMSRAELPAADLFAPAPEAKSDFPEYCQQFYCPGTHPVVQCQCACDAGACFCWNDCAETDFRCYQRCRDVQNNCYVDCQLNY